MYPTISQLCEEELVSWPVGKPEFESLILLLSQRKQPYTENSANHLLITVCTFYYGSTTLDKCQVSFSPLRGAANFKNKFCISWHAKINISVKNQHFPIDSPTIVW